MIETRTPIKMGRDSSETASEDTTVSSQQSTDEEEIERKRKRKKVGTSHLDYKHFFKHDNRARDSVLFILFIIYILFNQN